ncbi:MAG TPA: hypothetical protein VII14_18450 [Xanthobacteraceae bacterium]|jgi:hypothetical protein
MGAHNPILKDLLNVRQGVDELRLDMSDVKARMTAVEITMGQIVSLIATQSGRMDRIDDRLGRVERRLDLADA